MRLAKAAVVPPPLQVRAVLRLAQSALVQLA